MNERQFQRAVANRRCYQVRPLFAGPELKYLLRTGAAQERDLAALHEAWRRAAPQHVWRSTRVESFVDGTLRVAVADPVTRYFLLAQQTVLREHLRRALPGLRAIRFGLDENEFGKRE